jgi:hypothetical protein
VSYHDVAKLRGWRLALLVAFVLAGLILVPLTFFVSVAAGCPSFSGSGCVPASETARYAIFPGISLAMLIIGGVLRHRMKRGSP